MGQQRRTRKRGQFWRRLEMGVIILLMTGGLMAVVGRDWLAPKVDAGILRLANRPDDYRVAPATIRQTTAADRSDAQTAQKWQAQQAAVRSISALTYVRRPTVTGQAILGSVAIPELRLSLPILKGATSRHLQIGAGTLKPGQRMGRGNYAMAAHNMDQSGYLFSDLPKIRAGAKIYLTDLTNIYVYRAETRVDAHTPANSYYYHRQVRPTNSQPIRDNPAAALVTLVTCNATGSAREIVQGKYVAHYAYATASESAKRAFDVRTMTRTTIS